MPPRRVADNLKGQQPKVLKLKKRQRQDRFLALRIQGRNIGEACVELGMHRQTYYEWCKRDPWFADRADAVGQEMENPGGSDFITFRKAYFAKDTYSHQKKIVDALENAPPRSITMVLLPPGGGKTDTLEDYFNYKLALDPNFRIAVISETRDNGRKILRKVSNRMIDDLEAPDYVQTFGPFKPPDRSKNKPWNADVITLVASKSAGRDYNLEVRGAGSAVYGASYDLIVLDDIQSAGTLNKTESLLIYFRQTLFSRIMRANSTGRVVIIGTRQGPGDFYEELLKDDIVHPFITIPVLVEHPDDGTLTSYFPKRKLGTGTIGFDEEDLDRIRKVVGEEAWSRQYMQEPQSKHGRTFTDHMIAEALDDKRSINDPGPHGWYRVGSLDPALGGHSVARVAAFDYERLWLLDGEHAEGLARYEDLYAIVDRLSAKWQPNVWVIEGNSIQKGLLRDDRLVELSKKHGFRIEGHQTGRNKQDQVIGVASMDGMFRRHELSIPNGDQDTRSNFAPLLADLRRWRPDVPSRYLQQDEVMALWFLYFYWQKTKPELATRLDSRFQARALPYAPMGYRPMSKVG